jgi:hypothetical protein
VAVVQPHSQIIFGIQLRIAFAADLCQPIGLSDGGQPLDLVATAAAQQIRLALPQVPCRARLVEPDARPQI